MTSLHLFALRQMAVVVIFTALVFTGRAFADKNDAAEQLKQHLESYELPDTLPESVKYEYGETTTFWECRTLVIGTITEVRVQDDGKSFVVWGHLKLRIDESIPARHQKVAQLSIAIEYPLQSVRDRPTISPDRFGRVGDCVMLMVRQATLERPMLLGSGEKVPGTQEKWLTQTLGEPVYVMMPSGSHAYGMFPSFVERNQRFLGPNDPLIAETKRLCRILTTENPAERVTAIDEMLKEKPLRRVKSVLKHSLETSIKELEGGLDEATRVRTGFKR